MLKMSEIRSMDKEAISKKVSSLMAELFELKLQKNTTGLEKPHKVVDVKKDIARLQTVLNEK